MRREATLPGDALSEDHVGASGVYTWSYVSYMTGPRAPEGAPAFHWLTLQTHIPVLSPKTRASSSPGTQLGSQENRSWSWVLNFAPTWTLRTERCQRPRRHRGIPDPGWGEGQNSGRRRAAGGGRAAGSEVPRFPKRGDPSKQQTARVQEAAGREAGPLTTLALVHTAGPGGAVRAVLDRARACLVLRLFPGA